jgi:hypothetical protein
LNSEYSPAGSESSFDDTASVVSGSIATGSIHSQEQDLMSLDGDDEEFV